jgi:hypothetical protein
MTNRWSLISLAAIGAVTPAALWAQQSPRFPDPRLYNDELTPGQIQRAQERDLPPDRSPSPPKARPKQQALPARAVECAGVFARDSSHLKLATVYKSENVVFTDVDAGDGKKLKASVLFPSDPKRRLEVWWTNEAARTGTYLIVINGQSTWTAPRGLKLGLQLAAIERLNGKPFKLKGLDKDNIGTVTDWQGGTLGSVTGGCKVGVFLRPDPRASAGTELSASAELESSDASVKAIRPTVSEVIIGY